MRIGGTALISGRPEPLLGKPPVSGKFRNFNLLVILGPTASGKTRIGVEVARILNGEIISADSRQVYRGMDLGTGKDLKEYGKVSYHLIDIVDPGYEFNVFEFQRRFSEAFSSIQARGKLPILVGGTGLYLEAVLKRYCMVEVPRNETLRQELKLLPMERLVARLEAANLRQHNTTDLLDRERVTRAIEIAEFREKEAPPSPLPFLNPVVFGIRWPRKALRSRIGRRLLERMNQGMIEETKRLRDSGVSLQTLEFYGLEYRFLARYLKGEFNRNDLFQKLNSAIHQFAKRQETWFHRMERRGIPIHWIDGGQEPTKVILEVLRR
jgi:tRNA dimethylallyltransferase